MRSRERQKTQISWTRICSLPKLDHASVVAENTHDTEIVATQSEPHGSKSVWSSRLVKAREAAPCLFLSVEVMVRTEGAK